MSVLKRVSLQLRPVVHRTEALGDLDSGKKTTISPYLCTRTLGVVYVSPRVTAINSDPRRDAADVAVVMVAGAHMHGGSGRASQSVGRAVLVGGAVGGGGRGGIAQRFRLAVEALADREDHLVEPTHAYGTLACRLCT